MSDKPQDSIQKSLNSIARSVKEIANTNDVKDIHAIFRDFAYQQSTKFSEIARTLIIGVLGGAWAASLKDGNFTDWNISLCAALILACIYLGVDAIHYFVDSERYRKMCEDIAQNQSLDGVNKEQTKIANASNCFFISKMIILVLSTICFIMGFIIRYF